MKKLLAAAIITVIFLSGFYYGAGEQEGVTISLVGDLMFSDSVDRAVKQYGEDGYFADFTDYMRKSDFVAGNLEVCLSNKGVPIKDKEYTFKGKPEIARLLKKNNLTLISIANNHTLDFGKAAFLDMLDNLDSYGISFSGGGRNRSHAESLTVVSKNGIRIGFAAFSRVVPYVDWYAGDKTPGINGIYKIHEAAVLNRIGEYSGKCDILIVSLHWGKEGSNIPGKEQIELAHKLVDAGAGVIMGHHSHVVQGIEMYKGSPIFYSLGNFAFTSSKSQICNKTMMATLKYNRFKKLENIKVIPGLIKYSRPVSMDSKQEKQFIDYLNRLNINYKLQ